VIPNWVMRNVATWRERLDPWRCMTDSVVCGHGVSPASSARPAPPTRVGPVVCAIYIAGPGTGPARPTASLGRDTDGPPGRSAVQRAYTSHLTALHERRTE
jgi:hypothetical protein